MPIDSKCAEYTSWAMQWARCRDFYDGSDAVKKKGSSYLPQLDSMKTANQPSNLKYEEYKARALFYNATGRTVDGLSGAIFQNSPTITIPEKLDSDVEDITMTGVHLELFALRETREVLKTGRAGVLVDMPPAGSAEQRPYWVAYRAEDIYNWRMTRMKGVEVLTLVVLHETYLENKADDPYAPELLDQFRELYLEGDDPLRLVYKQRLWRKAKDGDGKRVEDYTVAEEATPMRLGKTMNFIPSTCIGTTSTEPAVEKSPILDLVDVNLSHYQTSADYKHGLHLVALPTPYVSGLMSGSDGPLSIGSGVVWMLAENGKAGMLEYTGAGIGSIRTELQDLQVMMATLGARLLEQQAMAAETATAVGMRHAGEHATLRTIAQSIERALSQCLKWHTWWSTAGVALSDPQSAESSIELNKDYFNIRMDAGDLKAQLLLLQSEAISYETFYANIAYGGWTREGVDAKTELDQIRKESASLPRPPIEPKGNPKGTPMPEVSGAGDPKGGQQQAADGAEPPAAQIGDTPVAGKQ